jgi:integrase
VSPKFAGFVRQERVGVLPNFLEAARTEKLEALYIRALTTGMRQGELLGLKWEDIDLQAGTLHIRRTLSTAMGEGYSFNPRKRPGAGGASRYQSWPSKHCGGTVSCFTLLIHL